MAINNSSLGLKSALAVVTALLIGTGIYTSSVFKENKETVTKLETEKKIVLNDLSTMATKYEETIKENEVANTKLEEAKAQIDELMASLKSSKATISNLLSYKNKYVALQQEMEVLLRENDELRIKNQELALTLDKTLLELNTKQNEVNSYSKKSDSLANALHKSVNDASKLAIYNLKGFGLIERTSGKLIPTERARRSDKLKVCFDIPQNKLAPEGKKSFYIQIIDPKNNVIGENETRVFGDDTLNYSLISNFDYTKEALKICEVVSTNDDEDFEKGAYRVSVFNEDNLVSMSKFELK